MAISAAVLLLLALPAVLSMYGPLETSKGLSDNAKYYIMCQHNKLRAALAKSELTGWKDQPKAADMQCMCWCDELVPKAQEHASNCGGPSHDKRADRKSANFGDVGQSLMDTLKSSPIDEAMEAFLEEINGYSFHDNSCDPAKAGRAGVCGHYTALMWAHTRCLGCAYDQCDGHQNGRLVCNYGPGGNIIGKKPYTEGPPCSKCGSGQKCLNGALCCDCSDGQCDGPITDATSPSGACDDIHPSCAAFKAMESLQLCSPTSAYYGFAKAQCAKTCNMCAGALPARKFCTSSFNVTSDKCSVHSSDNAKECVTGNGLFYVGKQSKTASNYDCLAWSTDDPRMNNYHNFEFPERSKVAAKNYCRNPGSSGSKPWCYVTGNSAGWEYCNLPDC